MSPSTAPLVALEVCLLTLFFGTNTKALQWPGAVAAAVCVVGAGCGLHHLMN